MSNQVGGSATAMSSMIGLVNTAKDKWNTSGGNEMVGKVSAAIPESTKNYVSNVFKREHIRAFSVFFGIGEERAFYLEKVPSLLVERLRHNVTFFYLNYLLLTGVLFCLTLVINPSAVVGMAILAAAWMWVIRASQSGALKIGGVSIPQQTATIGMGVVSIFVLLYLLSSIFWWTLFTSGFFVAVHAFMRDASMHKDLEDAVAMEGDLHMGGEDAAFLNVPAADVI
eukprot:CAMPEP_0198136670 /NCGR_PEP_ID=MMETSP1443-20131203/298_1 /TAXON_ID=186043 /ORGANISM="Entomoneis sp., Strain CCMP2396" /LENGTH=225 /DNA_ID=CAMNT_0043797927 /DNA_START=140 /DNA_END=817 /DNA_ORIENTATION=-